MMVLPDPFHEWREKHHEDQTFVPQPKVKPEVGDRNRCKKGTPENVRAKKPSATKKSNSPSINNYD